MLVTNSDQLRQNTLNLVSGVEAGRTPTDTVPAATPQPGQPQSTQAVQGSDFACESSSHFSMISTISYGSLATAYQALRTASSDAESDKSAILSAQGVAAALAAYDEVNQTD